MGKGENRCLERKVSCPKLFPSLLYSISPLSSQGERMQESQVVWGALHCKRKCPFPCPFALSHTAAASSGSQRCLSLHRGQILGLPAPLPRHSTSCLLEEGTASSWEGCPPAFEQQRKGLCSPKSTEGA